MTGYADPDAQQIALDAGFDCLIRKPFPFDALLRAVATSLGASTRDRD